MHGMSVPARIGIFGGSFDPVHAGHIALAQKASRQYALDTVYFVPAKQPPHKLLRTLATTRHRLNMLRLVCKAVPHWRVSHFELNRTGTTFTWQTVAYFRNRFPRAHLFFILGSDSLNDLRGWQCPERIADTCTILTGTRAGNTVNVPDAIATSVACISGSIPAVSSTTIRSRMAAHQALTTLVPRAVAHYMKEHNLYEHT
jgi:nicotinate-nucleotide adenylyltransferase